MAHLTHAEYGKTNVRLFRIVRNADGSQDVVEYFVEVLLQGDIDHCWTKADNSPIVATDSTKNIIYVLAKKSPYVLEPEKFALDIGLFFLNKYGHLDHVNVSITQLKWSRIPVDGVPHKWSFVRDGDEKRIAKASIDAKAGKDKISASVQSGLKDLLVLKSSGSSFENYIFDEFTTLKPVQDRIFSTAVDASYDYNLNLTNLTSEKIGSLPINFNATFAAVRKAILDIFAVNFSASVQATLYEFCDRILAENKFIQNVSFALPNKHYLNVDFSYVDKSLNVPNHPNSGEVFYPIEHPSGYIKGTVSRDPAPKL